MKARHVLFCILALLIAALIGFYTAVFTDVTEVVLDGENVIPVAQTRHSVQWTITPSNVVRFFNAPNSNPCSTLTDSPPKCSVDPNAGLGKYMYTVGQNNSPELLLRRGNKSAAPGGAATASGGPQFFNLLIKHCTACPTLSVSGAGPGFVSTGPNVSQVGLLCYGGIATAVPQSSANPPNGSIVEWFGNGGIPFNVTFDNTKPAPCQEGSTFDQNHSQCTVQGTVNTSYNYTITLPASASVQACQNNGTSSLTVGP
jgi:hypothetical protein